MFPADPINHFFIVVTTRATHVGFRRACCGPGQSGRTITLRRNGRRSESLLDFRNIVGTGNTTRWPAGGGALVLTADWLLQWQKREEETEPNAIAAHPQNTPDAACISRNTTHTTTTQRDLLPDPYASGSGLNPLLSLMKMIWLPDD
jgi:hypothetical protein